MANDAKARYDKKTAKYFSLKLNRNTDSELIEQLESLKETEGIQGYLKHLIREDISVPRKWIENNNEIHCPACGAIINSEIMHFADMNYCPYCGAKTIE